MYWAQEGAVLTRGSTPFKITSLTSRVSSITCQHRQGSLSYFLGNWRLSQCVRCAVSVRLLKEREPKIKIEGDQMLKFKTWSLKNANWATPILYIKVACPLNVMVLVLFTAIFCSKYCDQIQNNSWALIQWLCPCLKTWPVAFNEGKTSIFILVLCYQTQKHLHVYWKTLNKGLIRA